MLVVSNLNIEFGVSQKFWNTLLQKIKYYMVFEINECKNKCL